MTRTYGSTVVKISPQRGNWQRGGRAEVSSRGSLVQQGHVSLPAQCSARQGEELGSAKPGSTKPGSAKLVPRHATLVLHGVSVQGRAGSIPGAWLSCLCGVRSPPPFRDPPFFGGL